MSQGRFDNGRALATKEVTTMKALVYHGPGKKAWEEVPDPTIVEPTDVIVQVETTTICGTDLHILKGDVPAVTEGRILGHEGVAPSPRSGPRRQPLGRHRVIISCTSSCGALLVLPPGPLRPLPGRGGRQRDRLDLRPPDRRHPGRVRARARSPTTPCTRCPRASSDEAAVMLSDILPTGFEIGVRYGRVKPGDVVAVVGAGPVGLAAMMTAGLYGAAADHRHRPRRQPARAGQGSSGRPTRSTAATAGLGRDRSRR